MHSDEGYVLRALKAGAKGYLLKDSAEGDLIEAIRAVTQGKTFFSPEISQMLVEDYVREIRTRGVEDSYELLTSREREILQMLAEGKSNKEIADRAESESLHGGNASPESAGKTEPAQLRGADSICGPQRRHFLAAAARESCDPFRPEAFQYMSASFIARPTSSSRNGFVNTS